MQLRYVYDNVHSHTQLFTNQSEQTEYRNKEKTTQQLNYITRSDYYNIALSEVDYVK